MGAGELVPVIAAVQYKEGLPAGDGAIGHRDHLGQFSGSLGSEGLAGVILQSAGNGGAQLFAGGGEDIGRAGHPHGEGAGIVHGDGDGEALGALGGVAGDLLHVGNGTVQVEHQAGHGHLGRGAYADLVLIGVAVVLGELHLTVVHQNGQPGPPLDLVAGLHVHLGDGAREGGGDRQVGQGLLQVGELALGALQVILQVGDLVLVIADLVVQLRVILLVEQVAGLHGVARRDVDLGDLRGGGHRDALAVSRQGDAGALDGGGQTAGGQSLGKDDGLLAAEEEPIDPKRPGGQDGQDQKKDHDTLDGQRAAGPGRRRDIGSPFCCEVHDISLLCQIFHGTV